MQDMIQETARGIAIVHDDGERWACSTDGFQPVPEDGGFKEGVCMQTFVNPEDWKSTLLEAVADCKRRVDEG